ncbi:MAG: threonine dehydrogenase-like Zn-dependent dehydrogenase [Halioglobus sp.]|jgi:threonine dehydrogenase-like Zn-dependent dehydrogenase
MSTMQQLSYIKPKILEWQEVAKPSISTDLDAVVRPIAVARCDLDLYLAVGSYRTPGPFALGHETVAVVSEIGTAVTRFRPGDQVIVPFQISCGVCSNCKRGWTNACHAVPALAAYGLGTHPAGEHGGALSDYIRVPFADEMLVQLPDSLTPEAACGLSDNVADGFRTVSEGLKRFPGEPVLVVGGLAQSVGLYAVHAALALGSSRVVYTDFDSARLAIAAHAGAQTILMDYAQPPRIEEEFLITVDASALAGGLTYALLSTAPCGHCTGVSGGLTAMTELPLNALYLRGITYDVSRVHSRSVLPEVLKHACAGHLNPLGFAKCYASFEDAEEAMFDPSPKVIFSRR